MQKVRKFGNVTIDCRVPQYKLAVDKNQSLIKMKAVVPEKNAKNWETLQLASECHSINKYKSLIKIRPVVPEKNAKK